MAANVKRVAAVLASIVWVSVVFALLAGFVVPDLRAFLPPPVRQVTDPDLLRKKLKELSESLPVDIGVFIPGEMDALETPTPEAEATTPPQATPLPATPTVSPPATPTVTPSPAPTTVSEEETSTPEAVQATEVSVSVVEQSDLRAGPSEDADLIGLVAAGGNITITGVDATGEWYRLEDDTWISAADLVEAPVGRVPIVVTEVEQPTQNTEPDPAAAAPPDAAATAASRAVQATVNADANLRSGPGVEFERVGGVYLGEEVSVVAVSADGEWYLLEDGAWLFVALVVEEVEAPVVTVQDGTVLWQEADTEAEQEGVESEQEGAESEQEGAESEQEGAESEQEGAESEQEGAESEQEGAESEQSDNEDEQPQPVVTAQLGANLRSGPGLEFDRVRGVEQGHILTVVGQNLGGDWLRLEDGIWIFAALVANVPPDLPVVADDAAAPATPGETSDGENGEQAGMEDDQDTATNPEKSGSDTEGEDPNGQTEEELDLLATVNTDANFRNAPGLIDTTIVGTAPAGTQVTIVGQSEDGLWFELDNGYWIYATLVNITPE